MRRRSPGVIPDVTCVVGRMLARMHHTLCLLIALVLVGRRDLRRLDIQPDPLRSQRRRVPAQSLLSRPWCLRPSTAAIDGTVYAGASPVFLEPARMPPSSACPAACAKARSTQRCCAAVALMPADVSRDRLDPRHPALRRRRRGGQGIRRRAALKDRIAAADGLLLVTPEYNNSIPGVIKNADRLAVAPGRRHRAGVRRQAGRR